MTLEVAAALACAREPSPRVVEPGAVAAVRELVARYPLAATANLRADAIARTSGASYHFVQVRGGETPHRHLTHDLTVTVLLGEGRLTMDGVPRPMRAGDVAVIPRGVPHWFVNTGRTPAAALAVFVPPLDEPDTEAVGVDSDRSAR